MKYHIEHISSVIEGNFLQRHDDALIEQLLIDSRKLIFPHTSLFFALKSARRDGHSFIENLYNRGVRNFVVSENVPVEKLPEANIVQVRDTVDALQALAAWHRNQFSIPVVGITGSNGKTIVKEWLDQLLESQYNIIRSPRSYNSQIGVPLSIWPMNESHELAIFEAGISQRGEMERLEKMISPTIGIFTNIGEAHSEGFHDLTEKVREKLRLFIHVKTLIYCRDQPEVEQGVQELAASRTNSGGNISLFNWSMSTAATLQVVTVQKEKEGATVTARYRQETISITIPFSDNASIENAIHCWCFLLYFEVPATMIDQQFLQLAHLAMRLEMKTGINNCSVINDSYSADLSSFNIALDFLSQQAQHPKRTVILSDILQSGRDEKELYTEVAHLLRLRQVNRLIGIGESISHQQPVFEKAGIPELAFYHSIADFKNDFRQLHFRDETILLKGARVFEFEEIDRLLEQQVHQTVLEIDLRAVVHNLNQFQRILRPGTRLMAMVKAFSYGSGSFEIANVLQYHKIDYLAVAYADEGIELRKGGIHLPVMVMNVDPSNFDVLVQYNLEPDLYSPSLLHAFDQYLKAQGIRQFPVHIELETGMNRLGFSRSGLSELLEALQGDRFKVQSVFSHLAASEDPQHDAFTRQQASLFMQMVERIQQVLPYPFIRHISNTAGISRHPDLQLDMVRLGIGLYGIDSGDSNRLELQEVSSLKSTIAQIKELEEGETVSYGRRGVVNRRSRIATVRIGYADGYPRSLGNGAGKMWVNGQLAPVIGTVCMDMTMIDITDLPHVQEGDEVIVFGKELSVQKLAHWANTIPYQVLTGISQRVKRIYFEE